MGRPIDPIVVDDLRGGRNDTDSPMSLPLNQATEYLNCDWKDTAFARKRGGATAVSQTGGTAFSSGIQTLERHTPSTETAAELWGIDGAATPIWKRLTGGTTWADVTVDDAVATKPQDVVGAALNNKRFFAYDSSVDRAHVYDPSLSSPRVRRMGFATPAAPTAANSGAGAYAATLRYYRVRWLQVDGTKIVRRSEPGASVSFTPSGAGTGVTITRPAAASEGETHWEWEWSADDSVWYLGDINNLHRVAIATTTATDLDTQATHLLRSAADPAGMYGRMPSVKFLMTDGNRILGGGAWEASGADSLGLQSRVWHTPVLGSADKGDDERVENMTTRKGWTNLNESDGGGLTGCGGPLGGVPFWFKYRQVWKLQPTSDAVTPYLPRKLRDDIGCIAHKTIAIGQDQYGNAAIYFLSHRGPYRIVQTGIGTFDVEYIGRDNEVTWRSMNLAATTVVGHSVYYPDLHQWWVWIATGSSNDPDVKMVFDVQLGREDAHNEIRGGWAKHTGDSAGARCSCLFSNTLGASMSRDLKPHIGRSSGAVIGKCDTADLDDFGTDFQAYVTTRPLLATKDLARKVGLMESTIIGKALAGSDVSVTINRDFGKETPTPKTISLAPAASETRVVKKVEASEMGEADVIQITVGDSAANEEAWSVDAIVVPVYQQEKR
jgi:hypothetical protein